MERLSRSEVSRIVRDHLGRGVTVTGPESFQFVVYDAFVVSVRADDTAQSARGLS